MDVHYSSGVFNKAFCTLANTEGWSTKSAFITFATANQECWTPTTGFNAGAQCVVYAADDLGHSAADVADAFSGVGITGLTVPGTGPASDIQLSIQGLIRGNKPQARLSWTGAVSSSVVIKRDGEIIATTANDGAYNDRPGSISSYVYEVCEDDGITCDSETVDFTAL
jgi:hypothetical protein